MPKARPRSTRIPSNPLDEGVRASVPNPPVGPRPVGIVAEPSIGQSIVSGYPATSTRGFFHRSWRDATRSGRPSLPPLPASYASPGDLPEPREARGPSASTAIRRPASDSSLEDRSGPLTPGLEIPRPTLPALPVESPNETAGKKQIMAEPPSVNLGPPSSPLPLPDLASLEKETTFVDRSVERTSAEVEQPQSRTLPVLEPSSSVPAQASQLVTNNLALSAMDVDHSTERKNATKCAAVVGAEIITYDEVKSLTIEKYQEMTAGQYVNDQDKQQAVVMIAQQVLQHLVDQRLILQEARRQLTDPKKSKQFDDFVIKRWMDEEVQPLCRKHSVTNEYELKQKLEQQGKSYQLMVERYRDSLLERDFLMTKIKNQLNADIPEQRKYYAQHQNDFQKPARITWREIEFDVSKCSNRAEARRMAETAWKRLNRREAFSDVARSMSHGPTATQGGLYVDMTPGSYGVEMVNQALAGLPIGQPSGIIEGPESFHVVMVESRRSAGPLRFDEVQRQILETLFEQKFLSAREQFLVRLRNKTVVRTMLDGKAGETAVRSALKIDPAAQKASTYDRD